MWYKNVGTSFFPFVTVHAFDRRTDGRTFRSWLWCALHYMQSCGKNSDDNDDDIDDVAYVTTVVSLWQDVRVCGAKTKRRQRMSCVGRIRAGTARRRHRGLRAESHRRSGSRRKRFAYVMHRRGVHSMLGRDLPPISLIATDAFATNQVTVWRLLRRRGWFADIWRAFSRRIAGLEFSRRLKT